MVKWCQDHDTSDDKRFEKINSEMEIGKKVLYGGTGILVFIQLFFEFIK